MNVVLVHLQESAFRFPGAFSTFIGSIASRHKFQLDIQTVRPKLAKTSIADTILDTSVL